MYIKKHPLSLLLEKGYDFEDNNQQAQAKQTLVEFCKVLVKEPVIINEPHPTRNSHQYFVHIYYLLRAYEQIEKDNYTAVCSCLMDVLLYSCGYCGELFITQCIRLQILSLLTPKLIENDGVQMGDFKIKALRRINRCIAEKITRLEYLQPEMGHREYIEVIEFINYLLESDSSYNEKIKLLNFTANLVRCELQYDTITKHIYSSHGCEALTTLIPNDVFDAQGNTISCAGSSNRAFELDIATTCVLCWPSQNKKLRAAMLDVLRNGFVKSTTNQHGTYYSALGFAHFTSGNHHITAAKAAGTGRAYAYAHNTQLAFPHLRTNGSNWLNAHTGTKLLKVLDFRVAILYEIARLQALL